MEQLQQQINDLQMQLQQLNSSSTIPRSVEKAIRQRLNINGATVTITTRALTGGGANGSMTFRNGVLISQVQST